MFPTVVYLSALKELVQAHPQVYCQKKLIAAIDSAGENKQTIAELNDTLQGILNERVGRFSRLGNVFKGREKRRSNKTAPALAAALNQAMLSATLQITIPSPRGLPGTPRSIVDSFGTNDNTPETPKSFWYTLHLAQLKHKDSNLNESMKKKVNNAITQISDDYKAHHEASLNPKTPPSMKAFHLKRLQDITSWMEEGRFEQLVHWIKTSDSGFSKSEIAVLLLEDTLENQAATKQQLLNWMGIIFDEFAASENTYGASEVVRLFTLISQPVNPGKMTHVNDQFELFKQIYMDEDGPKQLNLDHYLPNAFLVAFEKMREAKNMNEYTEAIQEMKPILQGIYVKLIELVNHASQAAAAFERLSSRTDLDHPSQRSTSTSSSRDSLSTRFTPGYSGKNASSRAISLSLDPTEPRPAGNNGPLKSGLE